MAVVLVHIELDADRPSPGLGRVAGRGARGSAPGDGLGRDAVRRADQRARGPRALVDGLARAGADRLIVAAPDYSWRLVLDYTRPRVVLLGADDPAASDLVGGTASHLGARVLLGLCADDARFAIDDYELVAATVAIDASPDGGYAADVEVTGALDVLRLPGHDGADTYVPEMST